MRKTLPASLRALPWWGHALLSLLISGVIFAVFTLYQKDLPHPEDFSPQVFFVASLLLLAGCVRMGPQALRGLYWLILGLCVFIFLDEIAYGVELVGFEPIYIERYNFYIRDVHSSIGFVRGVLQEWLPEAGWNPSLFASLLRLDLALLAGLGLLWWLARWGMQAASADAWQARSLRLVLSASLLTSLVTLAYMLSLPADPKNAFLLGLSPFRLAVALGLLAASGLAAWLLRPTRQPRLLAWLGARMGRLALPGSLLLAALVLAGLVFQVQASFTFLPDALVRLERILPLALWATAQALWLWLGIQLWTGRLRTPLTTLASDTLAAFRSHPSFIYVAVALGLIFVAQLIDQNYLPLDEMLHTPGYHIEYWAVWVEESLEMIGAFLFAAAALVMPGKRAVPPTGSR